MWSYANASLLWSAMATADKIEDSWYYLSQRNAQLLVGCNSRTSERLTSFTRAGPDAQGYSWEPRLICGSSM